MVRLGARVRTKQSGALLSAHLACALLAHFASKVCSLQAKCALKSAPDRFCDLRPSQEVEWSYQERDATFCALSGFARDSVLRPTCELRPKALLKDPKSFVGCK